MFVRFLSVLVFMCLAACSRSVEQMTAAIDLGTPRPEIWRYSDGDNTVWIFGSVHALPPGEIAWHRGEIAEAFKEAHVAYQEAPRKLMFWNNTGPSLTAPGGDASRWNAYLTTDEVKVLDRLLLEMGGNEAWSKGYEPIELMLMLTWHQLSDRYGKPPVSGVESAIVVGATGLRRDPDGWVELPGMDKGTVDDLVDAVDIPTQFRVVRSILADPYRYSEAYSAAVDAWRVGDSNGVACHLDDYVGLYREIGIEKQALDDRASAWVDLIGAAVEGTNDTLFVVGSEYVYRDGPLNDALIARGFQFESVTGRPLNQGCDPA